MDLMCQWKVIVQQDIIFGEKNFIDLQTSWELFLEVLDEMSYNNNMNKWNTRRMHGK